MNRRIAATGARVLSIVLLASLGRVSADVPAAAPRPASSLAAAGVCGPDAIPGTLDGSFDGDGLRSRDDQSFSDALGLTLLLAEGDRPLVVTGTRGGIGGPVLAQFETTGANDSSYGDGNGFAAVGSAGGLSPNPPPAAARQPDGKVVIVSLLSGTPNSIGLARVNDDGSADTAFGNGGIASFDRALLSEGAGGQAVVVQPDGKLLLAGSIQTTSSDSRRGIFLVRFNADGTLDDAGPADSTPGEGFGVGDADGLDGFFIDLGAVAASIGGGRLALQQQGSRGVLVFTDAALSLHFMAFDGAGRPDSGFGSNGLATVVYPGGNVSCQLPDLLVQPDQKLLFSAACIALGRLNANGTLDSSFGGDGLVFRDANPDNDRELTFNLSNVNDFRTRRIALQADGKILLTSAQFGSPQKLARFFPNGLPDTGFGDDRVDVELPPGFRNNSGLQVDSLGRIVFADTLVSGGPTSTLAVGRLCGGASADTRPDSFRFDDQAGVPVDTLRSSNSITVSGLREGVPALLRVENGSYSIGCGAVFTDEMGKVANGQSVCLQHRAASTPGTSVSTVLRIGAGPDELSDIFTSTTAGGGSPGTLQFAATSFTAQEGGNVAATVNRVDGTQGAVSVVCTPFTGAGQSATSGTDYAAAAQTLNWPDGDATPRTCTIASLDDALDEADETFTLALSAPAGGATLGTPGSAVVTLGDNDEPPAPGVIAFSANTFTVTEDALLATIEAQRSGGRDGAVSVRFATADGSALAGLDYATASGTLSWADQEAGRKTFSVTILNDSEVEGDETVNLQLSSANGGALLGSRNNARLNIRSEDLPPAGSIQFERASFGFAENAGPALIRLLRVGGSAGAASVRFSTRDGTALSGGNESTRDYTATTVTVNFADGELSRTVSVPLSDDSRFEPDETVNLELSSATGAALGSPATAVLSILNDEPSPGQIRWVAGNHQLRRAAAGASTTARICAVRDGGRAGAVSANVIGPVSGISISPSRLDWPAGDTTPRCVAATTANGSNAGDFSLSLTGRNGSLIGTPALANVALLNPGDASPASTLLRLGVGFAVDQNVPEGSGTVSLRVQRRSTVAGSVRLRTADGGAVAEQDYAPVDLLLEWATGDQSERVVQVPILDDRISEGSEFFRVLLQDPAPADSFLEAAVVHVFVSDDDLAGTVRFSSSAFETREGSAAAITLERSGGDVGEVEVEIRSLSGGTATDGSDFTGLQRSVRFADGQTTLSLPLATLQDSAPEADETVRLRLAGVATSTPQDALLTIRDDDNGFRIDQAATATIGLVEDQPLPAGVLTVSRSGGLSFAASVQLCLSVVSGGAVASDLSLERLTVNFAAGEAGPKAVPLALIADTRPEGDEGFRVQLCSGQAGVADTAQRNLLILDDDAQYCLVRRANTPPAGPAAASLREDLGGGFDLVRSGGLGIAGSATVAVTRLLPSGVGKATPGQDFRESNTVLSFAPGQTVAAGLDLGIVDDAVNEPDEDFLLRINAAIGGRAGNNCSDHPGTPQLNVRIFNDDAPLQFNGDSATATVLEGSSIELPLAPQGASVFGSSVLVRVTAQSATADTDFRAVSQRVVVPGSIPVEALADGVFDDGETLLVTLTEPQGVKLGAVSAVTVTIRNQDAGLLFGIGRHIVQDLNRAAPPQEIEVPVVRRGNTGSALRVRVRTADRSARAGVDYVAVDEILEFPPGLLVNSLTLRIFSRGGLQGVRGFDLLLSEPEPAETVLLSAPIAGLPPGLSLIEILDDPPPRFSFAAATQLVDEDSGVAMIRVLREQNVQGSSLVSLRTVEGSALRGVDFSDPAPLSVSFADGEREKTIAIPVIDNRSPQPNRSFTLEFASSLGNVGSPSAISLTIVDDETRASEAIAGATRAVVRGGVGSLRALAEARSLAKLASGTQLPLGRFTLTVTEVVPGTPVVVGYRFPAGTRPQGYAYCVGATCEEFEVASLAGDRLKLVLVDGSAGDADGLANGVISHQGGPTRKSASSGVPQADAPGDGGGGGPADPRLLALLLAGALLRMRGARPGARP